MFRIKRTLRVISYLYIEQHHYYAGWRYCILLPCELLTGSDLVLLGLQSPEAALAVHRDAELADVGEQLHDLRVSGAEGDHWSLCCQRGGNVVKTLITVNRRDSQRERERETGLSKSQLPHSSHAQQAGSSVTGVRRHLIGQALSTLVPYWPGESVTVRRHESMTPWSDRLKVNF